MKTTRKLNTIKSIIAMVLTLTLTLTGATLDSITTEAKIVTYQKDRTGMEDARLLNGTTINMKVGDTKKIDMTDTYGSNNQRTYDATRHYAWASSDETIVSMQRIWGESVGETLEVSHVIIKAEKPGTATITCTPEGKYEPASITVNVTTPKVTAKQKKCKHSWKTTKKATCMESGMKTCRKCKLQKVTEKKQHKFKTTQEERYDYTYYVIYQCGACICEDPSVQHNNGECENWCEEEFSTLDYGTPEAALAACDKHKEECNHGTGKTKYIQVPYEQITTYKDVTVCTSCGHSEAELDLIFNVNDPNETIWVKDM